MVHILHQVVLFLIVRITQNSSTGILLLRLSTCFYDSWTIVNSLTKLMRHCCRFACSYPEPLLLWFLTLKKFCKRSFTFKSSLPRQLHNTLSFLPIISPSQGDRQYLTIHPCFAFPPWKMSDVTGACCLHAHCTVCFGAFLTFLRVICRGVVVGSRAQREVAGTCHCIVCKSSYKPFKSIQLDRRYMGQKSSDQMDRIVRGECQRCSELSWENVFCLLTLHEK